ncbi:Phosphorylated adapter RNA export [Brachionus plicatilis]|uniref:Phosphorylated adapter RNA export protein n=1 Tax=Brachionus plicatilis TaxID=10195 RepID=A0A3M7R2S9_BRAPC|nr:Phosphorylated adapter RNA export [Brachionus plicatilis]
MSKINLKKFNLWTDTLNEENLCETIGTIDFSEDQPKKERGVESYKFENKVQEKVIPRPKNQRRKKKIVRQETTCSSLDIGERLGPLISFDESKPRSHIRVSEIDTDDSVAKEISRILQEPKDDVIKRCVKILGKKKSLELLYATEDIESCGGIPTSDGYRRRTPGGVFFQLLKKDDTILSCQKSKIFIPDQERKKKQKALKRLRKPKRTSETKKAPNDEMEQNSGQDNNSTEKMICLDD